MDLMHSDRLSVLTQHCLAHAQLPTQKDVVCHSDPGTLPNSSGFVAMLLAYRPSGGMVNGEELGQLLVNYQQSSAVGLADLLTSHQIFGFAWRNIFWIPMFQFELRNLTIRPESRLILVDLAKSFDEWGTATWFVQPNSCLDDQKPIDLFDSDFSSVLEAARSEKRLDDA